VLEVLVRITATVEERRLRGDRRPQPGKGLIVSPGVFEVFAGLAVENAGGGRDRAPVEGVRDVAPAVLHVLDGTATERRGDDLTRRQLGEIEVVAPCLLEVFVPLGERIEEREREAARRELGDQLEPPLEALPRLVGRWPEAGDALPGDRRGQRPVLGLSWLGTRVFEAWIEDRHQSSPPVSPSISVTVPRIGNSLMPRRMSAGSELSFRSPCRSPILRTPSVSRMTLKTSDQAISPTGLPSASLMLKPKSTRGFGVPSGSLTRNMAARFCFTRSRTVALAAPWRR